MSYFKVTHLNANCVKYLLQNTTIFQLWKGPGIKKQAEFITNVSSCYASGKPGIKQAQAKYAKILFRKNDINRTLTSDLLSINQSEIK